MVGVDKADGRENQRSLDAGGIGYDCSLSQILEVEWCKCLLAVAGRKISVCTDYQIYGKLTPGTYLRVGCENVAEGLCGIGTEIGNASVDALLDLVKRHGGTVVEEEIVTVNAVLDAAVLNEQLVEPAGFVRGQVERLGEHL